MAYGLVDNKSGDLAEWDFENLSTQLRGLAGEGFDLSFTGFEGFEIGPLLQAEWAPPASTGNLEVTDPSQGSKALKIPADLVATVESCFKRIRESRTLMEPDMKDVRALELLCVAYLYGGVDLSRCPLPKRPVDSRLPKLRHDVGELCGDMSLRRRTDDRASHSGIITCPTCKQERFEFWRRERRPESVVRKGPDRSVWNGSRQRFKCVGCAMRMRVVRAARLAACRCASMSQVDDDVFRRAYVTADGDLVCDACGRTRALAKELTEDDEFWDGDDDYPAAG